MSDGVSAFTFRTWSSAWNSGEWLPGPQLLLHVDDGGSTGVPQALSWGAVDGAQSAVVMSPDLASCYGHHVTAGGDVVEIRGELQGRPGDPFDVGGAGGYEFDTEIEDTAGWRPAGRLRLLIDDGAELPLRWVAWRDQAGHAFSVALRSVSPSGNADITDMVTTVWASAEHRDAGEVAANLVDGTNSKWFAPHNRASVEFRFPQPVVVDQYVLTSANDAPDRDPRSWVLHGSADGNLWRTLDSRGRESFAGRHQPKAYRIFVEPGSYDRYRLDILQSDGSPDLQLEAVRFLAGTSGFTGYRHRAGHAPVAYRGVRVVRESPDTSMKPLPEGLPMVTESLGARDVSRQHRAELKPGLDGGRRENKNGDRTSPKPESPPLTVTEWRAFLRDYSSTFLNSDYLRTAESDGRAKYMLSQAQREAGWLGCEPAAEEAVLAAEERLGVRLPPTYRNFLLTSNGWSSIGGLDLLKVEEIGWFPDRDPQLFQAWSSPGLEFFADKLELLKRCLLISIDDGGSGGHWLLHADSAREDGEWTAYEWWPGEGGDLEENDNFATMVASAVDDFS